MTLDDEPFRGPDLKAGKRIKDKGATRKATLAQRTCVICGDPAANAHHVIPKGSPNFGDDIPANLVGLCGSGTTGCHGDVEGRRGKARAELGTYLVRNRPDTIAYVREKLTPGGDAWLKRHYKIKEPK